MTIYYPELDVDTVSARVARKTGRSFHVARDVLWLLLKAEEQGFVIMLLNGEVKLVPSGRARLSPSLETEIIEFREDLLALLPAFTEYFQRYFMAHGADPEMRAGYQRALLGLKAKGK